MGGDAGVTIEGARQAVPSTLHLSSNIIAFNSGAGVTATNGAVVIPRNNDLFSNGRNWQGTTDAIGMSGSADPGFVDPGSGD